MFAKMNEVIESVRTLITVNFLLLYLESHFVGSLTTVVILVVLSG